MAPPAGRTGRSAPLYRAEAILRVAQPATDVDVRITQGVYDDGGTGHRPMSWRFYVPGHSVSLMPVDYDEGDDASGIAGRPVFRGASVAGACWMAARLPEGHPGGDTNLRFLHLKVERYSRCGLFLQGGTGPDSHGITAPTDAGVNHNTVYGMVFSKIGTKHVPVGDPSDTPGYAGAADLQLLGQLDPEQPIS